MTVVVDTGALVALLSRRDTHHEWAVSTAKKLPLPWISCEAVFSETYHRLSSSSVARQGLLALVHRGALSFPFSLGASLSEVASILEKYSDLPTSVADACLFHLASPQPGSVLWTTDRDFLVYRTSAKKPVKVLLPGKP
jgi:predicted nucleic acid-binding protein